MSLTLKRLGGDPSAGSANSHSGLVSLTPEDMLPNEP